MAMPVDASFLDRLKSIYPQNASGVNPWYIIAAVGLCASNKPEAVPEVFQHALKDLQSPTADGDTVAKQLMLARRFREALFKAGLTCGYARTINALVALHKVTPEELRDKKPLRRTDATIEEHDRTGYRLFCDVYGETAGSVLELLRGAYPDMALFSVQNYGTVYAFTDIVSAIETSYVMIASLIASDLPRQIEWHLAGARRGGATIEEVRAVRQIAMEVATRAGVEWRDEVPDVKPDE